MAAERIGGSRTLPLVADGAPLPAPPAPVLRVAQTLSIPAIACETPHSVIYPLIGRAAEGPLNSRLSPALATTRLLGGLDNFKEPSSNRGVPKAVTSGFTVCNCASVDS